MKLPKAKPIRAWGLKDNNKLSAMDIFIDKDVVLQRGQQLVRVEIKEI